MTKKMVSALTALSIILVNLLPATTYASSGTTIEIIGDLTIPTNKDITLQISVSDDASGIKNITLPNGEIKTESEFQYIVTDNGTYEFKAEDNAGNITQGELIVNSIDRVNPNLELTPSTTDPTNKNIIITAKSTDDKSGVHKIILPNGKEVMKDVAEYEVEDNGEYVFKALDLAGNQVEEKIEITNINKVGPEIEIEPYDTDWTNKDVLIKANSAAGVLRRSSYTFTQNGNFTFMADDIYGNTTSKKVEVEHIDKKEPSKPIMTVTEDGKIEVAKPSVDNESGVKETLFKIEEDPWRDEIVVDHLDVGIYDLHSKSIDYAGNESPESTMKFEVRKDLPIIEIKPDLEDEYDNIKDRIDNLEDLDDVKDIQDDIDKLPDGSMKDDLQEALDDKVKELEKKNDEDNLSNLIKEIEDMIEGLTDPKDAPPIQGKIDKVPPGEIQDDLQGKLDDKLKELGDKDDEDTDDEDTDDKDGEDTEDKDDDQSDLIKEIERDIDNLNSIDEEKIDSIRDKISRVDDILERQRLEELLQDKINKLRGNNSNNGNHGTDGGVVIIGDNDSNSNSSATDTDNLVYKSLLNVLDTRFPYTILKGTNNWEEITGIGSNNLVIIESKVDETGRTEIRLRLKDVNLTYLTEVIELPINQMSKYKVQVDESIINQLTYVVNKGYMVGNEKGDLLLNNNVTVVDGLVSYNNLLLNNKIYESQIPRTKVEKLTEGKVYGKYDYQMKSVLTTYTEPQLIELLETSLNRNITKGEIADILYNTLNARIPTKPTKSVHPSIELQTNKTTLQFVVKAGLMGDSAGYINPKENLTRLEYMNILYNIEYELAQQRKLAEINKSKK